MVNVWMMVLCPLALIFVVMFYALPILLWQGTSTSGTEKWSELWFSVYLYGIVPQTTARMEIPSINNKMNTPRLQQPTLYKYKECYLTFFASQLAGFLLKNK